MVDSGAPSHWPFTMFDVAAFKCPERTVNKVFLHCSAWNGKALGQVLTSEINRWHQANGWTGIGYHFTVDHMGGVCTGRPLENTPAAQLGKNRNGNAGTIAIMTNGLWDFTAESLNSTYMLCLAIHEAYKLANKPVTFHGHTEIDPKPCPVYDYKALLGLDAFGNMNQIACVTPEIVAQMAKDKAAGK